LTASNPYTIYIPMPPESSLPYPLVAGFLNQLTHNLRNEINSLALGLDLLKSSLDDSESVEFAARLSDQIRVSGANLRELSAKIADPKPNREVIPAHELFLIWKDQAFQLGIEAEWSHELTSEQLNLDIDGVSRALGELLINAKQFGDGTGLMASAVTLGKQVVFELQEPKSGPLDHGEITDKGSINQRAVLHHRAECVTQLYATQLLPHVAEIETSA